MIKRYIKLIGILISFTLLTGFFPLISFIGPSFTVATSGSIFKAGAQYYINESIKSTTGKNSFDFVKEKIEKKNDVNDLNQQLKQLIERRVALARKKINFSNINQ